MSKRPADSPGRFIRSHVPAFVLVMLVMSFVLALLHYILTPTILSYRLASAIENSEYDQELLRMLGVDDENRLEDEGGQNKLPKPYECTIRPLGVEELLSGERIIEVHYWLGMNVTVILTVRGTGVSGTGWYVD